nr:MAG TPA: hypothetical protein [Caudoviricetes sp.]
MMSFIIYILYLMCVIDYFHIFVPLFKTYSHVY